MSLTTDPKDPRLGKGSDDTPGPQNDVYLVLSEEERAKGFVRPVRTSYVHIGTQGPEFPLQDLTPEQRELYEGVGYVKYEAYPESERFHTMGRFWTQDQLDLIGKGCGALTKMGLALAETYARAPYFYGSTYCVGCQMHRPVAEFVWDGTNDAVGS